jgi:hypothetical protein
MRVESQSFRYVHVFPSLHGCRLIIRDPQAELDALKEEENRKRKAAEEEEETKPQILERMAKKLKAAKEDDGGFVDLTEDD